MSLEKEIKRVEGLIALKEVTINYEKLLVEQLKENLRSLKFGKSMQAAGRTKEIGE